MSCVFIFGKMGRVGGFWVVEIYGVSCVFLGHHSSAFVIFVGIV